MRYDVYKDERYRETFYSYAGAVNYVNCEAESFFTTIREVNESDTGFKIERG